MRRFWLPGLFLLISAAASAQTLHGDPQKAAYANPTEWPTISSQCHWLAPNTGGMAGMPSHTHVDMKFPLFAEVGTGPFTVPFTITMFNTDGKIVAGNIAGTILQPIITLDAPFTFPLVGNPTGVVIYTGKATFDLSNGIASGAIKKHGWQPLRLRVVTNYTNHDIGINQLGLPLYSVVDVTAPESAPGDGTGIRTTSNCQIIDATDPQQLGNARWQSNVMEFLQILPVLGPITPGLPWTMVPLAYNYGATTGLPPGTVELRVDPDLHNGNPGTTIVSFQGTDGPTLRNVVLPDNVPDGTHKLMWMWRRPNMGGDKELDSLLVFNVTVGSGGVAQPPNNSQVPVPSGTPPPTTCTDSTATNFGGPLPCTYPPPRCQGMVGMTTDVLFSSPVGVGIPFHVTVTSEQCAATAVAF